MDGAQGFIPLQMELGVLLGQQPQPGQHGMGVGPFGEKELVGQGRLQHRGRPGAFRPQRLTGIGGVQAGEGADRPHLDHFRGNEPGAGIDADLVHFLPRFGKDRFHPQTAAGQLDMGQPHPLGIPGDFKDPGGKGLPPPGPWGKTAKGGKQFLHPLHLQGRAKKAGEKPSLRHKAAEGIVREGACRHIFLQRRFVPQGGLLPEILLPQTGKVQKGIGKADFQLLQQGGAVHGLVHFVEEEKGGDIVAL